MTSGDGLVPARLRHAVEDFAAAHLTLRLIDREFEAEGVPVASGAAPAEGQRRTRVRAYLSSLDLADHGDVQRFLRALSGMMRLVARDWPDGSLDNPFAELLPELRRCGFEWDGDEVHAVGAVPHALVAAAGRWDAAELRRQLARAEKAVATDPALAIGTAKEIVETTCKTVLAERGVEVGRGDDLPVLVKAVAKALRLAPDDVPEAAKGGDIVRRTLSNLGQIASGLAELRNLYGTGHGRHGRARGLEERHGRLALGAASALSLFLMETHEARSSPRAAGEREG